MLILSFLLLSGTFVWPQSCKHRDNSEFKLINSSVDYSEFNTALQRYATMHRVCSKNGIASDLLRPIKTNDLIKCRYVLLNIDRGSFGNRILTIISYFLLSMLTERVLLLQSHDYDIDSMFCQPFPGSDWLLNNIVDSYEFLSAVGNSTRFKYFHVQDINTLINIELTDNSDINKFQILFVKELDQYLIPFYYLNSQFNQILKLWFPDNSVAHHLISFLLHPVDSIWDDVLESFASKNTNRYSFGMQLRLGHDQGYKGCFDNIPIDADLYLAASSHPLHDTDIFLAQFRTPESNWVIYQQHAETRGSTMHRVNASVYDIWLLSLMDRAVVSSWSTAGYVVGALRNKELLIFDARSGACKAVTSYEPCCYLCEELHSLFHLKIRNLRSDLNPKFLDCENRRGIKLMEAIEHANFSESSIDCENTTKAIDLYVNPN